MNTKKLNIFTRKVSKPDIKHAGQIILTWTFLNLLLNIIGLFLPKLLNKAEYSGIDSIKIEFIIPLVIQSLLFGICIVVACLFLKKRKYIDYIFAALQFVVFHIIFFLNLKINHGIHFESTFHNLGVRYLSNCGQYLVDVLYLYFPINGFFENGLFHPDNLGTFYIHWILLNIVYYFALTWITVKLVSFIFVKKPEAKVETTDNESIESES